MAGAMRKMGVYLGLVEGQDGYDDPYDEAAYEEEPARSRPVRRERVPAAAAHPSEDVTRLDERRRPVAVPPVAEVAKITTLHPRTYNEARTLGEEFRGGVPVIMNLTEMDDNDAKRLVDFAAGLVFAVHGSIERVTSKVFLLSPPNVEVAAEEKQRIAEGGFFNQS